MVGWKFGGAGFRTLGNLCVCVVPGFGDECTFAIHEKCAIWSTRRIVRVHVTGVARRSHEKSRPPRPILGSGRVCDAHREVACALPTTSHHTHHRIRFLVSNCLLVVPKHE